ncbi:MAG TPA: biopolymer transporter ExbD [Flavobacteriales bacterium]|mgnify:CR=1 FL=1|jgi:biopolymer transport protein ExbD|nr:biopolymer transporter ExbD [Flavobacteriales bacterium]
MAKRGAPPEINASSMADIAFLLLVFFLVTTTMDTDFGLARRLPPPLDLDQPEPPPIKERNVFVVLVNANDQLLVEGELLDISELKEKAKEFIANPYDDENLPEKKMTEVQFFGQYPVSKQVISLQNDNGTSYDMYIQVQNSLAQAYNELREEITMSKFSVNYADLVEKAKDDEMANKRYKAVKKIYPQRISEAEPKDVGKQ